MSKNIESFSAEKQHTAMDKVAGFTYQFYCFLYHLLSMKRGEVVSFEKKNQGESGGQELSYIHLCA